MSFNFLSSLGTLRVRGLNYYIARAVYRILVPGPVTLSARAYTLNVLLLMTQIPRLGLAQAPAKHGGAAWGYVIG